jgi:uncharacterized phage-associated protein
MNALTAAIVADAIIEFCNEHGDVVTNLRLQKLLYYTQAWFLALHGKPLFADPIEARDNGPVQPDVFSRFSVFGTGPIPRPASAWVFPKMLANHITELMEAYAHLSPFDLERLSREEEPWKLARKHASEMNPFPPISTDTMRDFYKLRLNG